MPVQDLLDRVKTALADRYAIERELGAGGMATVYLAEQDHPRRAVAIKVLDPEFANQLMRERFPEARVRRFEDAGHYVFEDAAEGVVAELEGFLARSPLP